MFFGYKNFKKRIKIEWVSILVFLLSIHSSLFAQELDDSEQEMIDKVVSYIALEMKRSEIPGLSLAIVHEEEVLHTQGFGKADEDGRKITPKTPFILGSTTKSFTSMAILQLLDREKIDLDKPVQNYIPWFRMRDEDSSSMITLRHLLNHTSGISTAAGRKYFIDNDSSPKALEKGVRELKDVNLISPVGDRFIYSNLNYDILGLVVQMVSGKTYEDYIQQNIFNPLDMKNSYTDKVSASKNGLAIGYSYFRGKPYATPNTPYPRRQIPDGFLISSAVDLGHYMIAQLNEGQYLGHKLLSDTSMELYHVAKMNNYAMGWRNDVLNNKKIITHSGLVSNYKSNMTLLPDDRWGVALLINGQDSVFDGAVGMLSLNVARLLVGADIIEPRVGVFDKVFYGITVVLFLQFIGLIRTSLLIKKWRSSTPNFTRWGYFRYIIIPLILSVLLSISFLVMLPIANQLTLSNALLFAPDIAWVAIISGTLSLVWGTIRTALITSIILKNQTR